MPLTIGSLTPEHCDRSPAQPWD